MTGNVIDRRSLRFGPLRFLLIVFVVATVAIVAAVVLGWSLPEATSFELTPDPAGDLPF